MLHSSESKRRFRCGCQKSWSVSCFLTDVLKILDGSTKANAMPSVVIARSRPALDKVVQPRTTEEDAPSVAAVTTSSCEHGEDVSVTKASVEGPVMEMNGDRDEDASPCTISTESKRKRRGSPSLQALAGESRGDEQAVECTNCSTMRDEMKRLHEKQSQLEDLILQLLDKMPIVTPKVKPVKATAPTGALVTPSTSQSSPAPAVNGLPETSAPETPSPNGPTVTTEPPVKTVRFHGRPSFADIVKSYKGDQKDKPAFVESLAILQRRKAPSPTAANDMAHHVKRVYVTNLPRLPLSQLKKHLFNLRFQLSKILNISYVGKSIVEFLIMEDYMPSMMGLLRRLQFPVLDRYHPGAVQDSAASESTKASVKDAFVTRLARLSQESNKEVVRDFFRGWLKTMGVSVSTCAPNPSTALTVNSDITPSSVAIMDVDRNGDVNANAEVDTVEDVDVEVEADTDAGGMNDVELLPLLSSSPSSSSTSSLSMKC